MPISPNTGNIKVVIAPHGSVFVASIPTCHRQHQPIAGTFDWRRVSPCASNITFQLISGIIGATRHRQHKPLPQQPQDNNELRASSRPEGQIYQNVIFSAEESRQRARIVHGGVAEGVLEESVRVTHVITQFSPSVAKLIITLSSHRSTRHKATVQRVFYYTGFSPN